MKNLILALALCLSAVPAFAGNDGPNAAPSMRPQTIAKAEVMAMFTAPGSANYTSVEVLADGEVVLTRKYAGQQTKTDVSLFATLDGKVVASLVQDIKALSAGKPVDTSPGTDGCMDAPSLRYSTLSNGVETELASRMDCKDFKKPNENEADARVLRFLESLLNMTSIVQK